MTVIQCKLYSSGNVPLVGYVAVTLSGRVVNTDTNSILVPRTDKYPLVAGAVNITLEPTEDDRTTYKFEIYHTEQVTPEATEDNPTPSPITVESLVDAFYAMVPDYLTPIKLTQLARQTGITRDSMDTSLVTVIKRLIADPEFWQAANTNLFRVKGVYNTAFSYINGDVVNFDGSAWICVTPNAITGQSPLQYPGGWRLLVSKGDTGAGVTGNTTAYDKDIWVDNVAPGRVAVKNIIEQLARKTDVALLAPIASANLVTPNRTTDPLLTDRSSQIPTTNWTQALLDVMRKALIPVGMIGEFFSTAVPTGWLQCDGRVLVRASYPALFAVLSTSANTGGELATEFRLPDMRGRVLVGLDDMTTARGAASRIVPTNTLGASGGTQKHQLTTAELPSHSHNLFGSTYYNGDYYASGSVIAGYNANRGLVNNNPGDTSAATVTTGSNTAHNIMQPYISIVFAIYTGL